MKIFKKIYYKIFGKLAFQVESRKRRKLNQKVVPYKLITDFRNLEKAISGIRYPDNGFNKIMGLILSDIELFGHIARRFLSDRRQLKITSYQDNFFRSLNPEARAYPIHPMERSINSAIKIDAQSLFIFGMVLTNRSLLLLKMYLPDQEQYKGHSMYEKIGNLYFTLNNSTNLSPLAVKLKNEFFIQIKWLYSTLRFYRNEFIEHLDKGYQQGMNYGWYFDDFSISSYKWNYTDSDDEKIEKFRLKLEEIGVHIPGRSDGGRSLINRYYIQKVFDSIVMVPDELLKEALDLIEDIGVHSPQPRQVIDQIESYISGLFNFMILELDDSDLAKFKI